MCYGASLVASLSPPSCRLPVAANPWLPTARQGLVGLALWCGLLGAALVEGAEAIKTTFSVKTNYYSVAGVTDSEVRASLAKSRPGGVSQPYHAATAWETRYTFTYDSPQGRYRLTSCTVTTKAVVTMPFLRPAKELPLDLIKRWSAYFKGVTVHEQGHLRLAREATAEVGRRLGALGEAGSAAELTRQIRATADTVLNDARARERLYDEQTQHGATQGALIWLRPDPPAAGPAAAPSVPTVPSP
jgi:predicted secreted Zn-dependent protease